MWKNSSPDGDKRWDVAGDIICCLRAPHSHYVASQEQGFSFTQELISGSRDLWNPCVDVKEGPAAMQMGTRHASAFWEV